MVRSELYSFKRGGEERRGGGGKNNTRVSPYLSLADTCGRASHLLRIVSSLPPSLPPSLPAVFPLFPPHLQESHHRVEDDDSRNHPSLDPLLHGEGQGHGHEENQGHNVEQVPQEEDEGMHGMTAFQSIATKEEPALFHFQTSEAARGGGLRGEGWEERGTGENGPPCRARAASFT